jgi:hypothetical protein
VDRQAEVFLPSIDGALVAAKKGGNFLPGIEALAPCGPGISCGCHGMSGLAV